MRDKTFSVILSDRVRNMVGLSKTVLLISFYLCLHFHDCLPKATSDLQDSVENIYNASDDYVYKCLGRLKDTGETTVVVPGEFMSDGVARIFPLKRKELNCKKGRFKVLLQLPQYGDTSSENRTAIAKVLKKDSKTWNTTTFEDPSVRIMKDGAYLKIATDFFHPTEYCFDQIDPSEISLFVCFPECYSQRPCVTKCCAQDEIWDVLNAKCRKVELPLGYYKSAELPNATLNESTNTNVSDAGSSVSQKLMSKSSSQVWKPWLFSRSVDNCVKRVTTYHREQISVHFQQRLPDCDPTEYRLIPLRKIHDLAFQRFRVLWTGVVIMRDKYGNWSEFAPSRYCVDGMANYGQGPEYTGAFEDQLVLACPDQAPRAVQKKPIPLRYAVMLMVAAGILFLTALISGLLWDRQNVYEWTVCFEVVSMFFLILLVGIAHTVARKPEKSDFGSVHCVLIGAASHFFWLATFFWLFIINFEIWWNFRSLVQLRQSRKWFRFLIYNVVGWGCPLLVVGVGLLLDKTWGLQNEDLDCTNFIVPNYGQLNCYISKRAQGPYLFYPIGVILGCNLIFYLLTVCKMWGYQKKSQAIIQYRSRGQTQPILIFAKLFIVMGVSWIFEIVSWAVTNSEADRIPLYWVIFDIVTLFQAISIFVIFIWKKQVLSRLWYKYPSWKPLLRPLTKLPGCGLLPNDRDRLASVQSPPSANKIPRGGSVTPARLQGAGPTSAVNNNSASHLNSSSTLRASAEHLAMSTL